MTKRRQDTWDPLSMRYPRDLPVEMSSRQFRVQSEGPHEQTEGLFTWECLLIVFREDGLYPPTLSFL